MALHRLAGPAIAVIAGLALTGCGDDPIEPRPYDPSEQTSNTSSASATASPTESATPEPRTPEDTIREFVRVKLEMERSGDATDFLAMSYKCEYCRKYGDLVEGIYKRGGVMHSAGWKIRSIKPRALRLKDRKSFDVIFDDGATSYRWEKGAPIKLDRARKGVRYLFELRLRSGVWKIAFAGSYE